MKSNKARNLLTLLVCLTSGGVCCAEWGRTADDFITLPLGSPADHSSPICSDLNGGCWVAGDPVGLCHVDRLGNLTWGDTALWLEAVGYNAYLVPVDTASVLVAMQRERIYLQRINLAKELMWGQEGVAIDTSTWNQWILGLYTGPVEGTYLIHSHRANEDYAEFDPRLQLVDQNGELLWGIGGIGIGDAHTVITKTSDRCITYALNTSPMPAIRVHKLNSSGEQLWETRLSEFQNDMVYYAVSDIESDQEGGTMLVYTYYKRVTLNDSLRRYLGIKTVRVSGDGDSLWTRPLYEREIISGFDYWATYPKINYTGMGHFFVAWADYRHAVQAIALDVDGELLWDAPVEIAPDATNYADLVAVDSDNGVCYVWQDHDPDRRNTWQQWGQRIGPNGERLWGNRGRAIQANNPLHHSATSDCNGGVITVSSHVYPKIQMMNRNGEIGIILDPVSVDGDFDYSGPVIRPTMLSIYPNPGNSQIRVLLDGRINGETLRYSVYDLMGRTVKDEVMIGSPYWIEDLSRFPNGEYILQIQSTHTTVSRRFSLVK